jgi:hypothetical protein
VAQENLKEMPDVKAVASESDESGDDRTSQNPGRSLLQKTREEIKEFEDGFDMRRFRLGLAHTFVMPSTNKMAAGSERLHRCKKLNFLRRCITSTSRKRPKKSKRPANR